MTVNQVISPANLLREANQSSRSQINKPTNNGIIILHNHKSIVFMIAIVIEQAKLREIRSLLLRHKIQIHRLILSERASNTLEVAIMPTLKTKIIKNPTKIQNLSQKHRSKRVTQQTIHSRSISVRSMDIPTKAPTETTSALVSTYSTITRITAL